MGFSRQEYWSALPWPPPGDLPNPGMEPVSLMSLAWAGGFFTTNATGKPLGMCTHTHTYLYTIYHNLSIFLSALLLAGLWVVSGLGLLRLKVYEDSCACVFMNICSPFSWV